MLKSVSIVWFVIQGVPGGKVNILGGHGIVHSNQKCWYEHVLFRTVSEIELFECATAKLLIRKRCHVYVLFLIPVFIVQVAELVQGYNKCSKIPPSTSMHFPTRVNKWRVFRLSASWRSFTQAITSSMLTSSSSRVSAFFLYTSLFIKPHKQKFNGVKSGDFGGQLMVLPRPIHLLGKVSLRCCITCRV